ncbi:hypothetical protein [Rhodococcoides fascians]|uniref:hypothetical protein n=1 Tax=Rhodococcoides fascians TaxID=1828 RepID=UPI00068ABBA3|nr:hypothetical protein [Rhodococcus fascians]
MKIPCDGGPLNGQVVDVPLTREGRPPENITAMWPVLPAWATYGDPNPDLIIQEPRLHHYALGQWKCDVHGHEPFTGCPHLEHHLRYR